MNEIDKAIASALGSAMDALKLHVPTATTLSASVYYRCNGSKIMTYDAHAAPRGVVVSQPSLAATIAELSAIANFSIEDKITQLRAQANAMLAEAARLEATK